MFFVATVSLAWIAFSLNFIASRMPPTHGEWIAALREGDDAVREFRWRRPIIDVSAEVEILGDVRIEP